VGNARARRLLERLGFMLERVQAGETPSPGIRMDVAVYLLQPA